MIVVVDVDLKSTPANAVQELFRNRVPSLRNNLKRSFDSDINTHVAFEPKVFNDFNRIKRKLRHGTGDFDVRHSVIKAGGRELGTKSARRSPIADAICAESEISGLLAEISGHAELGEFYRTAVIVY